MLTRLILLLLSISVAMEAVHAAGKPTAEEYLAAVFRRYGQMSSYRDAGQVRLITAEKGKRVERVAPMRVAFDRAEFALQVYDVRAELRKASDGMQLNAWFVETQPNRSASDGPTIKTLHGQVLQRAVGRKNPRSWLPSVFADPVLAARLAAGLAGPPPQLDWLFSETPMEAMFAAGGKIDFVGRQKLDQRWCRTIDVQDGPAAYRFYIDEVDYLIRQVDMPRIVVQPDPKVKPETIDLVIELKDAQFNKPNEPMAWQEKLRSDRIRDPHFVENFVPPPPPEPPRHWGREPKTYEVKDRRGDVLISSRGTIAEVSIVIPEVDAGSKQLAEMLEAWIEEQDKTNRSKMQLVVLGYDDRGAAIALGMSPKKDKPADRIGVVDRRGHLVWASPTIDPAVMNSLAGVVTDTLAEIDVAKRVRGQWQKFDRRYREAIGR